MRRPILFIFLSLALLLILPGCRGSEPTPTPAPTFTNATVEPATNTPAPLPQPTNTPVELAPTQTPEQVTESVEPSATVPPAPPAASPVPTVVIRVQDGNGNAIAGANVLLTNATTGFAASFATTDTGQAIFTGVDVSTNTYRVEVTASGYQTAATDITIAGANTEISITLEAGVTGVTTTLTNLRNGPGTNFDIVAELPEGESLAILGVDATGQWFNVSKADRTEGWVFSELVTVQGDLGSIAGGAPSPNTPTPPATGVAGPTVTPTATVSGTITGTLTPTPVTALPTRPAPIPFDAAALRAEMNELENLLFQMGGLLDRVAQEGGEQEDCGEYLGYYAQIAATPIYSDVPAEWADVHTEFQRVVDSTLSTNRDTATYCVDGAIGALSNFYYSQARGGVNDGLSLLYAVMAAADDQLSQ